MKKLYLQRLILISSDIVSIVFSFIVSILVSKVYHEDLLATPFSSFFNPGISKLLGLSIILVFAYMGHYTKRKPFWEELLQILKVVLVLFILNFGIAFILQKSSLKIMLTVFWLTLIFMLVMGRSIAKKIMQGLYIWQRDLYIIGTGKGAAEAYKLFAKNKLMGYNLVGFVNLHEQSLVINSQIITKENLLNRLNSLDKNCDVIVALPSQLLSDELKFINHIQHNCLSLMMLPEIHGLSLYGAEVNHFFGNEQLVIRLNTNLSNWLNRLVKRIFDLTVVVVIIILISPIMLIIALTIKVTTRSKVFYSHKRVGINASYFGCLKFQTMYPNSKELLDNILNSDASRKKEWEETFKLKDDPRVTPVGKFLRETSLDELPQLFNVLAGQMSLVGPRPIVEAEIERYNDSFFYYQLVLPGITGLWQISGRSDVGYAKRVALDECYVRNWSLWYDIVILIKTVSVVIKKTGAY